MVEKPNLVTLKYCTRALQILNKTSNVELEGTDSLARRMIKNFNWRVHLDKFFVHNEDGLD